MLNRFGRKRVERSAIERCETRRVQLQVATGGIEEVDGYVYNSLAAHPSIERDVRTGKRKKVWDVSHLPTGLCVSADYVSLAQACEAMVEIFYLRNDWHQFTKAEANRELAKQIVDISLRHHGRVQANEAVGKWGKRLNGF
jgi:hypothetical protein